MTKLLEEAFDVARGLPAAEQDAIAASILAEIEDEGRWDASFQRSADILAALGAEAVEEHRDGRTLPLDPDRM